MKSVRSVALLFALALLAACGTSPLAPEIPDPVFEEDEPCVPVEIDGEIFCRGFIGSSS